MLTDFAHVNQEETIGEILKCKYSNEDHNQINISVAHLLFKSVQYVIFPLDEIHSPSRKESK